MLGTTVPGRLWHGRAVRVSRRISLVGYRVSTAVLLICIEGALSIASTGIVTFRNLGKQLNSLPRQQEPRTRLTVGDNQDEPSPRRRGTPCLAIRISPVELIVILAGVWCIVGIFLIGVATLQGDLLRHRRQSWLNLPLESVGGRGTPPPRRRSERRPWTKQEAPLKTSEGVPRHAQAWSPAAPHVRTNAGQGRGPW